MWADPVEDPLEIKMGIKGENEFSMPGGVNLYEQDLVHDKAVPEISQDNIKLDFKRKFKQDIVRKVEDASNDTGYFTQISDSTEHGAKLEQIITANVIKELKEPSDLNDCEQLTYSKLRTDTCATLKSYAICKESMSNGDSAVSSSILNKKQAISSSLDNPNLIKYIRVKKDECTNEDDDSVGATTLDRPLLRIRNWNKFGRAENSVNLKDGCVRPGSDYVPCVKILEDDVDYEDSDSHEVDVETVDDTEDIMEVDEKIVEPQTSSGSILNKKQAISSSLDNPNLIKYIRVKKDECTNEDDDSVGATTLDRPLLRIRNWNKFGRAENSVNLKDDCVRPGSDHVPCVKILEDDVDYEDSDSDEVDVETVDDTADIMEIDEKIVEPQTSSGRLLLLVHEDSCERLALNKSREKGRRVELKIMFNKLANILPTKPRVKQAILHDACDYIKLLEREQQHHKNEIDLLQQKHSNLLLKKKLVTQIMKIIARNNKIRLHYTDNSIEEESEAEKSEDNEESSSEEEIDNAHFDESNIPEVIVISDDEV